MDGTDRAGARTAKISAPTLIADGTVDRLDPLSNTRALPKLIPNTRLVLYPDTGHAFLFQDPTTVAFAIKSFLTRAPKPDSTSMIRKEFLAGQTRVTTAGRAWATQLKALHPGDTSVQVAKIDERLANSLTQFDEELLNSGATGRLKARITMFVAANENLADDILATSETTRSTSATLKTTFAKDGTTAQIATSALRHGLGLPPAPATR